MIYATALMRKWPEFPYKLEIRLVVGVFVPNTTSCL
jgi:hypothetical protein